MKAVIWTKYGPPEVLTVKEIDKPVPDDDEILVKIYAANVTSGDCEQRALKLPFFLKIIMRLFIGLTKPRRITILGMDLSGKVEAVGQNVTSVKPEEKIIAATGFLAMGAYAEYICLPVNSEDCALAPKPDNVSWEEAAALPTGGLESLYFLKKAGIKDRTRILIIGGGGTIGTFALQLAKDMGAEVTAIDSTDKLPLLKELGADNVVDRVKINLFGLGAKYDVVLDIAGHSSLMKNLKFLKNKGIYLRANPDLLDPVRTMIISAITQKTVISGGAVQRTEDLRYLSRLIQEGYIKPVVDRIYNLSQVVEAHKYVESGLKKGNVILKITSEDRANR